MQKVLIVAFCLANAGFACAETEQAELESLKTYCKPDIERLCHGVEFGGGAVKTCLKEHEKQISVGCAEALKALKQ